MGQADVALPPIDDLWASWDSEDEARAERPDAMFCWCVWCEDRPATGFLVLTYSDNDKAVRRGRKNAGPRPAVCNRCQWDADDRVAPDCRVSGRPRRWVFVSFRGRR